MFDQIGFCSGGEDSLMPLMNDGKAHGNKAETVLEH